MTTYRVLAAVLAVPLLAAAANYYLDLGWFGNRGRLVLSMLLLSAVVLIAVAIRRGQDRQ